MKLKWPVLDREKRCRMEGVAAGFAGGDGTEFILVTRTIEGIQKIAKEYHMRSDGFPVNEDECITVDLTKGGKE